MMYARHILLPIVAAITLALALTVPAACAGQDQSVRPAYCAGGWYPGDSAELAKLVDKLMAEAKPPEIDGKPIAVISPHAGYRFSAPTAAAAYACLRGHTYNRVIVIAFSHRYAGAYHGIEVPKDMTAYSTPLGDVPIDRKICDSLLSKDVFLSRPGLDRNEHSLELQLPYLQKAVGDFKLVPLMVGQMTPKEYAAAAEAILPYVDDNTLLVASSDFTHYGIRFDYTPFKAEVRENLHKLADDAAAPILECDFDGFRKHLNKTGDTICGRNTISLLLRILAMRDNSSHAVRTGFDTSGDQTGEWSNSVTYQSFVFTERPGTLGAAERQRLLKLARETVSAKLKGEKLPKVDAESLPPMLKNDGACFVTLENHGRLRGCIGHMVATEPLYQNVKHNAVAATKDYRFVYNPVTAAELGDLHIEISYLTPMKKVEDIDGIIIGRDGLLIQLGGQRGVLLPQVAGRYGWTRDEFLAQVCRKAGLPLDAWKQPGAEIYYFQAEVFGEPKQDETH